MKMTNPATDVQTSGTMDGFTPSRIAPQNMAQAMSMFSSNYSRPKDAVLRELAANGLDSQRRADVTCPIEITLPTVDHAWLRVSDSGQGLSTKDILDHFGDYLESTKREDDTQHGTFGIGAKSPYAVADQFHVTAVKDGIKTVVLFARRDGGVPGYKIVSTEPTDAPNGVVVTVPVALDSIEGWVTAANRVFFWWEPGTVAVRGLGEDVLEHRSYRDDIIEAHSTETVRYLKDGRIRSVARIGTIGYSIPSTMWQEQNISFQAPLVFQIGLDEEVTIAHSRETIEDTQAGRELLKRMYFDWINAQEKKHEQALNAATSTHDAMLVLDEVLPDLKNRHRGIYRWEENVLQDKGLPTSSDLVVTQYVQQSPRSTYTLDSSNVLRFGRYHCVAGVLSDRDVRMLLNWRNATNQGIVNNVKDPSRLMPMIDPAQIKWITIDEMIAQTPKPPKRERCDEDPVFAVITGSRRGVSTFDQDGMDVDELKEAIAAGAKIVAGTKREYDEIVGDKHRWLVGSDATLAADHLRNAIKVMRGTRSVSSLAKLLGAEVLSPREYRDQLRLQMVNALSKNGKRRLAEHTMLESSQVSRIKEAPARSGLDPAAKKTLSRIAALVGANPRYTPDELLMTEPSLPQPSLQQECPALMDLLRNHHGTPSAVLLNAVVAADRSTTQKGIA